MTKFKRSAQSLFPHSVAEVDSTSDRTGVHKLQCIDFHKKVKPLAYAPASIEHSVLHSSVTLTYLPSATAEC